MVVFINLLFAPLLPLYAAYKIKKKPLRPNLDLLFQYGIAVVCNIPLTKIFIFLAKRTSGIFIPMDSGYYTLSALLPTLLAVLLYKIYKTYYKSGEAQGLAQVRVSGERKEINSEVSRDVSIDTMKGILVFLMVLAHVVQFFPINSVTSYFSLYVNLTTFSGFMFTFGYVSSTAYIHRETEADKRAKRLFRGGIKTLGAFYLSGIAYSAIIRGDMSLRSLIRILLLTDVPGYSEFLLSFSFMYLLVFIFHKPLKNLDGKGYLFWGCVSLALTLLKQDVYTQPIFAALIGVHGYASFPVLLYFSYFLAGVYLSSRRKVFSPFIFVVAIVGTISFFVNFKINGAFPNRFPPSIFWVTGGYIFIYAYYLLCKKYRGRIPPRGFPAAVGRRSLWYLVSSNIIIFALHRFTSDRFAAWSLNVKFAFCILTFIFCIGVTFAVLTKINTRGS